jgi:hypothetical protein
VSIDQLIESERGGLLAYAPTGPSLPHLIDRNRARRRRAGLATVTLIGVAVVGVVVQARDHHSPLPPTIERPAMKRSLWRVLDDSPAPVNAAIVSIGDRLFVWGGERDRKSARTDAGKIIDLEGRATPVSPAPLIAREEQVAVWTGTEVIICCGQVPGGAQNAAAYNPTSDTWRTIAPPPVPDVALAGAIWTGREVIVVGGIRSGGAEAVRSAMAYDPARDKWRRLADVPGPPLERQPNVMWTNGRLYAMKSNQYGEYNDGSVWTYEPEVDRWGVLTALGVRTPSAAASDRWLFAFGLSPVDGQDVAPRAYLLNLDSGHAETVQVPLPRVIYGEGYPGSYRVAWTGDRFVVWTGNLLEGSAQQATLAFDPLLKRWSRLPGMITAAHHPQLEMVGGELVGVGQEVVALPLPPLSTASDPIPCASNPDFLTNYGSGDGFPPKGTATEGRANELVTMQGEHIREQWNASRLRVERRDGYVWSRQPGKPEPVIELDEIWVVIITVREEWDCVAQPWFYDGVPVLFEYGP